MLSTSRGGESSHHLMTSIAKGTKMKTLVSQLRGKLRPQTGLHVSRWLQSLQSRSGRVCPPAWGSLPNEFPGFCAFVNETTREGRGQVFLGSPGQR